MTTEQQLIILNWQIAAAILMGLDYFISDRIRVSANNYLKNYFEGIQKKIDIDVKDATTLLLSNFPKILISLLYIFWGIVCLVVGSKIESYSIILSITLLLLAICFIVSGFTFVFDKLFDFIKVIGLAAPFRAFTTYMVKSPKGPLAAIGFFCLCISFYLSYTYLNV